MSDKALELTVTGTVVDVNFRNWTAQQAQRLALGGWVRNNVDRSVTIVIEGDGERVDQFVEIIRRGPEGAHVDGVDIRDAEVHGYASFTVEY